MAQKHDFHHEDPTDMSLESCAANFADAEIEENALTALAQLLYHFVTDEYGAESFEMTSDWVTNLGFTGSELLSSISYLIRAGKLSREVNQDGMIRFRATRPASLAYQNHFNSHLEVLVN